MMTSPTLSVMTSSKLGNPNVFQYDNQTFYNGVRFGYKEAKSNITNQHKRSDFLLKRCGLQKMSQVRIVDNSEWAKRAKRSKRAVRVIQAYTPTQIANVGDLVLVAVDGHKKQALVVGQRSMCGVGKTRMDSSNVIIMDQKTGSPEGTRITVPIPSWLRNHKPATKRPIDMSKVVAIATTFV